jgi:hypothetical protein
MKIVSFYSGLSLLLTLLKKSGQALQSMGNNQNSLTFGEVQMEGLDLE